MVGVVLLLVLLGKGGLIKIVPTMVPPKGYDGRDKKNWTSGNDDDVVDVAVAMISSYSQVSLQSPCLSKLNTTRSDLTVTTTLTTT